MKTYKGFNKDMTRSGFKYMVQAWVYRVGRPVEKCDRCFISKPEADEFYSDCVNYVNSAMRNETISPSFVRMHELYEDGCVNKTIRYDFIPELKS